MHVKKNNNQTFQMFLQLNYSVVSIETLLNIRANFYKCSRAQATASGSELALGRTPQASSSITWNGSYWMLTCSDMLLCIAMVVCSGVPLPQVPSHYSWSGMQKVSIHNQFCSHGAHSSRYKGSVYKCFLDSRSTS